MFRKKVLSAIKTCNLSSYISVILTADFYLTQLLNSLKEDIKCYSPPSASAVEHSHILMLGPVGAGKSSFYNTIAAIFSGHITIHAPSGSAEQSLTSRVIIIYMQPIALSTAKTLWSYGRCGRNRIKGNEYSSFLSPLKQRKSCAFLFASMDKMTF